MAESPDDPAVLGDRELVSLIRDGSGDAAAELRRRHLHALQTVAAGYHRRDRDRDAAIDATIARLADLPTPTSDGEVILDLFALIRAEKAPEGSTESGPWGLADLVDDDAEPGPERAALIGAFGALDERDQVLLWFNSVDGALPPQLAERLSIRGADLAATLTHRARRRLREIYPRAGAPAPPDGLRPAWRCPPISSPPPRVSTPISASPHEPITWPAARTVRSSNASSPPCPRSSWPRLPACRPGSAYAPRRRRRPRPPSTVGRPSRRPSWSPPPRCSRRDVPQTAHPITSPPRTNLDAAERASSWELPLPPSRSSPRWWCGSSPATRPRHRSRGDRRDRHHTCDSVDDDVHVDHHLDDHVDHHLDDHHDDHHDPARRDENPFLGWFEFPLDPTRDHDAGDVATDDARARDHAATDAHDDATVVAIDECDDECADRRALAG